MRKMILLILLLWSALAQADLSFGKDLYNDKLYEEAILEFEKVVADAPTSEAAQEAIFYIGRSYTARGQFGRAENSFTKLVEGFPGNSFKDEVLHYLAKAQFDQQKYEKSISTCDQLLNKFPLSEWTRASLTVYLNCFLQLEDYNMVIIKAQKFEQNYENDKNIPNVLLILAKAYFANNIPLEGRKTLALITSEYQNFNAAWKAVELEVELVKKSDGIVRAAEVLAAKLQEDVPRTFEEPLRYKLAEYYSKQNRFDLAYNEQKQLIEKFNNSAKLDEYILFYSYCQLQLSKTEELISEKKNFNKVFRESALKAEYMLNVAEAYLLQNNISQAKKSINEARQSTNKGYVLYRCDRLQADILLQEGKVAAALDQYKILLDSSFADQNDLLLILGDVYYSKFQQFTLARKYYQRIITGHTNPQLLATAYYKVALCYEQQQNYNAAVEELLQINLDEITNLDLISLTESKKKYLIRFKQKDYENAFNELLQTLLSYSETSNKQALQNELIDIMAGDLKEYEKAIELLKADNSVDVTYTKAKLQLNIIEKLKAESNTATLFNKITELNSNVEALRSAGKSEWVSEIEIKKQLITASEINEEIADKVFAFTSENPESEATNEFLMILFNFYVNDNQEKAAEFAENIKLIGQISEEEFYEIRIFLAEYYYKLDNNEKALENYKLAEPFINLTKPEVYFHFAVLLNESDNSDIARQKLGFLVNNAGNYSKLKDVIDYYGNLLRTENLIEEAIKTQLLLVDEERTDSFWMQLSEDYLLLDDKENAKLSIMHIVEKNYKTLFQLGQLQFETGDLEMAKYTYSELVKQNKNDLKNHEYLGKIAFMQEEYLLAAQEYKIIIDKLGTNFADYDGIKDIALENIMALYRVKNRPKAETLSKKFKTLFSSEEINTIELNRAIYHSKTEKKKAEKILTSLIKGKNVSIDTRIDAYFWRGVIYLEQNKLPEAVDDFTTVAGSVNEQKSNEANLKLGTIKFSQEKYPEALEHYYTVIQNDKDGDLAFDAARNFAFVCKTIEEWQKAIAAYEIILDRWGDQELEATTIFDIAFCHYRDKKYTDAAEMFSRAIPLLSEKELKAEAQYWIGESYFGEEKYETAVSEFLKVGYNYAEFAHWAASAELKAGEAYVELDKLGKARRIYERIIDKYGRYSQWGGEAEKRLGKM